MEKFLQLCYFYMKKIRYSLMLESHKFERKSIFFCKEYKNLENKTSSYKYVEKKSHNFQDKSLKFSFKKDIW